MQDVHKPADAEQRGHEPAETLKPIAETLIIGSLCDEPEDNAR